MISVKSLCINICCGPSSELPHQGSSGEGSQDMFLKINKKNYPTITCTLSTLLSRALVSFFSFSVFADFVGATLREHSENEDGPLIVNDTGLYCEILYKTFFIYLVISLGFSLLKQSQIYIYDLQIYIYDLQIYIYDLQIYIYAWTSKKFWHSA